MSIKFLEIRRAFPKVELNHGVELFVDSILVSEAVRAEILSVQAAAIVPVAWCAKASDKVGDGILVLRNRQAGQFNSWRLVALARRFRVEGVVDVRSDLLG